MKKSVLLFLAIILVTSMMLETNEGSQHSAYAQSVDKGEITASSLFVRAQPSTNGSIIGGYIRGTTVELHEQSGSWYKVRYNNRWGYIHGSHVKVTETSGGSSSTIGSGEVTATNLNVRASASTNSSIISSLRRGTTVDLHEKSGDWYKIKVGSRWGYVHGSYIKTASSGGSSGGSSTAPSTESGEVTAANLNVRASASTNSSIISSLRRGTTVELHEKTGDWYKIKVGSRWGYVHGSYIKTSNSSGSSGGSSTAPSTESGEVTAANLNVRASASTNSSIISSLRRGTTVELHEKTGDWYKIKVGNRWGYVHGSYIKTSNSSGSSGGSSTAPSIESGEVTATNLNVRASASTNSSIISSLRNGTKVDLHEKTGDWYKIKVGNGWGFIHSSFVSTSPSDSSPGSGSGSGSLSGKTIFIDPGHGGRDPGAVNGNVHEKTIALQISQKVEQALKREGAQVVMSRSSDTFVALGTRVTMANQSGADMFVSLHANAFPNSSVNGSEVLYSETKYPAESRRLAQEIQSRVASGMNMRDRGIVRRNVQVLTGPNMPAVLIEPGFMTNSSDLNKLLHQQDQLAAEIVNGIKNYYR
ncbi:hypothetical protein CR194_12875 [Salipaludibacillus keqinensis]|uniref:SH3b domain-containing protein n=1 Tax=Salipaludibacillus keqinensis TaxID=2045207 RepID=A0A323TG74_9BACI|nr:N-acetylmuramoyl-L-alanine amidase [Salipaludibacillus keqinensis]PYZ92557.1 hypothetical protein CR194_12875 [Salipaludibacillus keqinensis]